MTSIDLSALTLTQLRYLDALERHRSFRAAAEHCRVSQPGLSMQVQKLEELVGFTVFDRSLNPVAPTERGARLIEQARAVLREMSRLHDVIAAGEGTLSGSYRLGVIPTLIPSLVPPLLKAFGARYPNAELTVEEVKTEVLLRRLLEGSLHGGLAATPLGVAGVHETPLLYEELQVYLSPGHPLGRFDALREDDLIDQRPWLLAEGHCFRGQTLHLCEREQRGDTAGAQLRFCVEDDGEGFDPEDLPRLFTPFARGRGQLPDEARGLGLGLYLVRRIAEAHAGEAFARNGAERGALVGFSLPQAARAE